MDVLNLSGQGLTELPPIPAHIKQLNCNNNNLTELQGLPAGLEVLWCERNKLTSLPDDLPAGLTYLECSNNNLTKITRLPDGLIDITCSFNPLTKIEELPKNLTKFRCTDSSLSTLPHIPASVTAITCWNNQLKILPDLPARLRYLHCVNNQIVELPVLPVGLQNLFCGNNKLKFLPNLPESLETLNVIPNPFSPPLQAIVDAYLQAIHNGYRDPHGRKYALAEFIRDVNHFNVKRAGKNILGLHMLRSRLPLQPYNMPQPPNVPNWLSERVMHTLTGIRTKNVSEKNATTGKIRPPGNLRETLKNLKRKYNELPGRRGLARRRKQTKKRR